MKQEDMLRSLLIYSFVFIATGCSTSDWRTASRESAGLAPKASDLKESIFQIYTARAFSWRGYFGIHPWLAWKRKSDANYTVAQIVSWNLRRGLPALDIKEDLPDRHWYGNPPTIIFTAHGDDADRIIAQLQTLLENYPYKNEYTLWPGPNSNTFVEHVIRSIPELTVELPPHAIGKDFLVDDLLFAKSPSGSGIQFSIFGALGFTLGLAEGIEVNILGLTFGMDILRPALKLPAVGRVGMDDKPLPFK